MVTTSPRPLSMLYSSGCLLVRGDLNRNALMKKTSGPKALKASPSQESSGSAPLSTCVMAYTLTTANHETNVLIKMDLSKFNVVNSPMACENTGTD